MYEPPCLLYKLLLGHFLNVQIFGIAPQDTEGHRAYPDSVHSEAGEISRIIMASTEGGFVQLTKLCMILNLTWSLRWHHMNSYSMFSLLIKIGEEVVGSGNHFEVCSVAVPRHIDIPSVVRVLNEGQGILSLRVGEDSFDEAVDGAEVVDE